MLARYTAEAKPSIVRRRFRADAAFAIPALFDLLESEGWDYAVFRMTEAGLPSGYHGAGWRSYSPTAMPGTDSAELDAVAGGGLPPTEGANIMGLVET